LAHCTGARRFQRDVRAIQSLVLHPRDMREQALFGADRRRWISTV
jgi:hypothetical protein